MASNGIQNSGSSNLRQCSRRGIKDSALARVQPRIKSVNDLPDDVLAEVFLLLYACWHSREHPERTELAVCRRWYNVIVNMPQLWRDIHITHLPLDAAQRLNSMYLSRSRNTLIDVRSVPMDDIDIDGNDCSLIFEPRNAARIRTLDLTIPSVRVFHDIFGRDDWERLEMPKLHTLIVTLFSLRYHPQDIGPNPGPMCIRPWRGIEALQKLELNNFRISVFPQGTGLRELSINTERVGSFKLRSIFEHFPRLETLVIHDLEIPNNNEGEYLGPRIPVPHLRHLAIASLAPHNPQCNCGLESLVAPNIEIVEYHGTRRSLFNNLHVTILLKSTPETPRRLRVCNQQRTSEKDLLFYSMLPGHIDVEFAELPGDDAEFVVELLSSLSNLHSLTLSLYPSEDFGRKPRYHDGHLNPTNFSQIVRKFKPVLACPTFVRVFDRDLIPEDVRQILGHNLTVLVSPPVAPDWFSYCDHIHLSGHDWDESRRFWRSIGVYSSDEDSSDEDEDEEDYYSDDDDDDDDEAEDEDDENEV